MNLKDDFIYQICYGLFIKYLRDVKYMTSDTITYQIGTHYLSRIALRIERMLFAIQEASLTNHPIIHHAALNHLLELIKLIKKPELKGRFLKEFIRLEHTLNRGEHQIKSSLIASFSEQIQKLTRLAGQFGHEIHTDPFLYAASFTATPHASEHELHTNQLFFWLESDPSIRQRDLKKWLSQLQCLEDTVNIYLSLLRHTGSYQTITPENGFYQCFFGGSPNTACHLILLRINKQTAEIPKMQIGRHGLSLRLYEANTMREVRGKKSEIELSLCEL